MKCPLNRFRECAGMECAWHVNLLDEHGVAQTECAIFALVVKGPPDEASEQKETGS